MSEDAQKLVRQWESENAMQRDQWRNTSKEMILAKMPRKLLSSMLCLYAVNRCMSDQEETFIIDANTARDAISLANWLFVNQEFCWSTFTAESSVKLGPIHSAIARAILDHQVIPRAHSSCFPMPDLVRLANGYLRIPQSSQKIGLAANELGLEKADSRETRQRVIKKSTLMKMAFVLATASKEPDDDFLMAE